jgi:hypothetical protein
MKQIVARHQRKLIAMKALLLVGIVWGLLYPGLLWSMERLLK